MPHEALGGSERTDMDDCLGVKDHAEAVALFRSQIVGALCRRDLSRGELRHALRELAGQRFRRPGASVTRTISVATLERWYYAYRRGGIGALHPRTRGDRGRARALGPALCELLCDIRREHPGASVSLIVRTLVCDGRLAQGLVSPATVRRLFAQRGLDRVPLRDGKSAHTRLRWQAERPNALWHGDVCHGPALTVGSTTRPLRIHALLDDASRFVVALEAHHSEREVDLLGLLCRTARRVGLPDAFYLDNGSTYSGDTLRVACERLGVTLLHAAPYDPEARGKMERFWRTLREGCLDHTGTLASLHDVNVRLWAFLDRHYHIAPHAGLFGRAPGAVWAQAGGTARQVDEEQLRDALSVRERRRVRRDCTLSVDGIDWELDQGFLAGRVVRVGRCLLDPSEPPWVEHEQKRLPLHPVDPTHNARRRRPPRRHSAPTPTASVPFDPAGALLDRATGRRPSHVTRKESPR
jgi:transposase InsO family protein